MKHFKSIITLFVLTIALVSCSTDDDAPDVDTNLIVGEWAISDLTTDSDLSYTALGQTVTSTSNGNGSNFDYSVTFNEDNTLVANGSYDYTTTTSTQGLEDTQTFAIDDVNTDGTWSISGDQITFSGFTTAQIDNDFISGEPTGSSTIVVLNETTLIISTDLANAIPLDSPEGFDISLEGSSTVTLTRIN